MQVSRNDLALARVLHEDGDFLTLEVGKRDDVVFHLQQDENGNVVGGDRFLTLLFIKSDGQGGAHVWKPWEDA